LIYNHFLVLFHGFHAAPRYYNTFLALAPLGIHLHNNAKCLLLFEFKMPLLAVIEAPGVNEDKHAEVVGTSATIS